MLLRTFSWWCLDTSHLRFCPACRTVYFTVFYFNLTILLNRSVFLIVFVLHVKIQHVSPWHFLDFRDIFSIPRVRWVFLLFLMSVEFLYPVRSVSTIYSIVLSVRFTKKSSSTFYSTVSSLGRLIMLEPPRVHSTSVYLYSVATSSTQASLLCPDPFMVQPVNSPVPLYLDSHGWYEPFSTMYARFYLSWLSRDFDPSLYTCFTLIRVIPQLVVVNHSSRGCLWAFLSGSFLIWTFLSKSISPHNSILWKIHSVTCPDLSVAAFTNTNSFWLSTSLFLSSWFLTVPRSLFLSSLALWLSSLQLRFSCPVVVLFSHLLIQFFCPVSYSLSSSLSLSQSLIYLG